jgi:hypothetical protein
VDDTYFCSLGGGGCGWGCSSFVWVRWMLVAKDYSICLSVFLHLSILLRLYDCNVLLRAFSWEKWNGAATKEDAEAGLGEGWVS